MKRQLRAARAWKIGELPESTLGRVIGKAEALDKVMTGPLSGRPCLCYVATVEQRRRGSDYWRTIIEESRGVTFRLIDDTGHAIVDPANAKIALTFDNRGWSGISQDATELAEAFLAKHGHGSKGWVFNKSMRYHEAVIELGETVAVLGSGVPMMLFAITQPAMSRVTLVAASALLACSPEKHAAPAGAPPALQLVAAPDTARGPQTFR